MDRPFDIAQHRAIQSETKAVLKAIGPTLRPDDTERSIAARAVALRAERGLTETWYYDCPALVLLGSRSCLSISGSEYSPSDEPVGECNLVTIDLSPCVGDVWGDCARSFCIEEGRFTETPITPEFVAGIETLERLHALVHMHARPEMTFAELFEAANERIAAAGYENLDFLGNVGHSIERRLEDRSFIERENSRRLGDVTLFTFEPHIRRLGGSWGFKHENIYYFGENAGLVEL